MEEEEEEGGGEGWLVSYADLMTLLFATFVVLYGIKPEGETKEILGVTSSIRESFVEVPDEIPEESRKGPIKTGKTVLKYFKGDEIKPPVIKRYRRNEFALNIINEEFERVRNLLQILNEEKTKGLRHESKLKSMSVHKDHNGFTIRMISSLNYASGAYRLKKGVLRKVKKVGELIKDLGRPIAVEGHTDSSPPSGQYTNWELSALRASYLARFLIDKSEFPADMVTVAGYADKKPLLSNDTSQGRKLNRRVEIKVRYDHQETP